MINLLFIALAEAETPEKVSHWWIGAGVLVILLLALGGLLAFGRGREHS